MGKYAHYEGVFENSLTDLYSRHAEVARQIHQDILQKFTGNKELTVDLVRESPIDASQDVLSSMERYDVVSVSSSVGMGSLLQAKGLSSKAGVEASKRQFDQESMPIYIVAAGNNGKTNSVNMPRMADFSRTSLVVGEANMSGGKPYIEAHSSTIKPTLAADNPFNRGDKYQYYETKPSLVGREELIRDWLVDNESDKRFQEFKTQNPNADDASLGDAYWKIKDQLAEEKYSESPAVEQKIKGFIQNPDTLHAIIMADIRSNNPDVDENGYTSKINGTSFSSPEMAGYTSGAMYEQEQREQKNLPILTKQEIATLAKLATIDTPSREGEAELMKMYNNKANFTSTYAGGHGVFQPEMFRALLDESYKRLETNPDLDRDAVELRANAKIKELNGSKEFKIKFDTPQNVVVERTRLDLDYKVNGMVPHLLKIEKEGAPESYERMQMASDGVEHTAWIRNELALGETLKDGDQWKVKMVSGEDSTIHSASVVVYGYNKDGFMPQMMEYSQNIKENYMPKPADAPAPPVLPAPEVLQQPAPAAAAPAMR